MGRHKKDKAPPSGPTMKNVGIFLWTPTGKAITDARVYINGNLLLLDNNKGFSISVDIWNRSIGIVVKAPGYVEYATEFILPALDSRNFDITLNPVYVAPVIKRALPIIINGNKFSRRLKGRSSFKALMIFIKEGPDALKSYLEECKKYDVNILRVFCSLFGWADLDPRQYPMYRGFLRDFIEFCIAQGFNIELNALVGPELRDAGYDKEFVKLVSDISAEYPETLFKIGNELWRWYNVAGLRELAQYVNKSSCWAVTSPKMEGNDDPSVEYIVPLPEHKDLFFHGKWISIHSIRGDQQARRSKDILDIQGDYGVPCVMNEPFGAGFENGRTNEPRQHLEYSACGSLFGGTYFHSDNSIACQVLSGVELECLKAFSLGWTLIPEEYMNGQYTRYGLANVPIDTSAEPLLRSYFMLLGTKAMGVLIKHTDGTPKDFTPSWTNGWKLAGNLQCVYKLEQ